MNRASSTWLFGARTYGPLSSSQAFSLPSLRFFERIAKTYRREKWNVMLRPLFTAWYACAQKLGDVELTVKLLVEMIAYGTGLISVNISPLLMFCNR